MYQLKYNFYIAVDALVVSMFAHSRIGESPFHLVNQLIRVPDGSLMFYRFRAMASSVLQLSRFEGLKSCLFFHSYRIPEWRGKVNEYFYSSLVGFDSGFRFYYQRWCRWVGESCSHSLVLHSLNIHEWRGFRKGINTYCCISVAYGTD